MFGFGLGEALMVLCVALVFLGPKRLPEAGKKIGELVRGLRDAAETVKETVTQELNDSEQREREGEGSSASGGGGGDASPHKDDDQRQQ